MSNTMSIKAGRVLCDRSARQAGVDASDWWKLYGDEYIRDAQAMLDAVGTTDLLAFAKEYIDAWDKGGVNNVHLMRLAEKAIAKAEGKA